MIQEPKIKLLYVQWAIFNQSFYAKYFIVLAILFSVLLIPLDFLWFDNPEKFQNIRLLYIASLIPLILLLLRINPREANINYPVSFIMIYVSLAFNIKYIYFLYISTQTETYTIVLLANFWTETC